MLTVRVADPDRSHRCRVQGLLSCNLVSFSEISEVRVLERLGRRHPVRLVVENELRNHIHHVWTCVRKQLLDSSTLLFFEVELHVGCHFCEFVQQSLVWRTQDVMDFVNLVHFVVAGEQREQSQHLEVDTAHAPVVHLVVVIPISHQTLRRAVPTRRDVLREGRLRVNAPATTKVS